MHRRRWIALSLTAALTAPGTVLSQAPRLEARPGEGKVAAARRVEVKARVEAIEIFARRVTLRLDDGTVDTVVVSEDVENLDKVKVGDTVEIAYFESLTLSLNKIEGAVPEVSEKVSDEPSASGALPGGVRTREITVVAKVSAIDAAKSMVTLTGPLGRSVQLEVVPEALARVAVGDLVNAVYTEAMAVAVKKVSPK